MINEEIARKTLNMEVKATKVTGKFLLDLLKKLMKEAEKLGGLEKLVNAMGQQDGERKKILSHIWMKSSITISCLLRQND
ncbi:TPA: hypothetical protein U0643_001931 [Streptococcus suis]|nr:hypothetical protein [Streptococcus suis]HEM2850466.1 hypothetical protein [Streptococcus suis]